MNDPQNHSVVLVFFFFGGGVNFQLTDILRCLPTFLSILFL